MQIKASRTLRPSGRFRGGALGAAALIGMLALGVERMGGSPTSARIAALPRAAADFVLAWIFARPVTLQLDVAHLDHQKLARKRQQALDYGVLVSGPDDFVPARLRVGDRDVEAKVRLKGDMSDHWSDPVKWSFRVVVKGSDSVLGMKRFSIQDPGTRDYLSEWLMHEALRREGLPALRYDFVRVVLNGKDLGIYALEEHFAKHLVEASDRREGPIVRFDEDPCWAEIGGRAGITTGSCRGSGSGAWLVAPVDGFESRKQLEDPSRADAYLRALSLLEAFRSGELATHEVFDTGLLARSFAVLELLDRLHASFWRNARFYYNPVTSLLEPIAFDGGGVGQPSEGVPAPARPSIYEGDRLAYHYHLHYFETLFSDPVFYAAYVGQLERMVAPGYLEGLLEDLEGERLARQRVLQREFPLVSFDRAALEERRRILRKWIDPPRLVEARWISADGDRARLLVGNLLYFDVELLGLRDRQGRLAALPEPIRLAHRAPYRAAEYRSVSLPRPPGALRETLTLQHRVLGSSAAHDAPLLNFRPTPAHELARDLARVPANAASFDFAVVDEARKEVRIRPGVWFVREDFVVPAGYRLRAGPGTQILLESGGALVARGPVELVGSETAPVLVKSASGTGQGLLVLGAGAPSRLEHVRFEGLAPVARKGTTATGAVTFYESPVEIRHCEIVGSRGEDALNLLRSPFVIEALAIRDSASDGLDVDFSDGEIRDSVFAASGNDAVDLSGSAVVLSRVWVQRAGDKGLSAGERATVRGEGVQISGVGLGIASKDLSQVRLADVRIADARIGLAAYQKKAEFGGGSLAVEGLALSGVESRYLAEESSSVVVDGERLAPNQVDARGVLYENE
jgi:hypothetical protein